jgi:hypothetical protein
LRFIRLFQRVLAYAFILFGIALKAKEYENNCTYGLAAATSSVLHDLFCGIMGAIWLLRRSGDPGGLFVKQLVFLRNRRLLPLAPLPRWFTA